MLQRLFPLLVAALMAACAPPQPSPAEAPPEGEARVLFIGNSYTYVNNLPEVVAAFARELAPDLRISTDSVLAGGATLQAHWDGPNARARIRDGRFRWVVLQEQSMLGAQQTDGRTHMRPPEELFFPYARHLVRDATAAGARSVFFMTWSRENDLPAQAFLTRAYTAIAREQGAMLAPAGTAWERVRRERPEVKLYHEDGSHPSPAGTYLSACVIFATLAARPCTGAPATITGAPWVDKAFDRNRTVTLVALPDEVARFLQRVGSEVTRAGAQPAAAGDAPAAP